MTWVGALALPVIAGVVTAVLLVKFRRPGPEVDSDWGGWDADGGDGGE